MLEVLSIIFLVCLMLWFIGLLFKYKKVLKTKDAYKLLVEAREICEYSGYRDPIGKDCLLKAMKYAPEAENPFILYECLGEEFFLMGEDDLMHKCFDIAKKYYVPYSEEELYVKNGKLRRRRKKGY